MPTVSLSECVCVCVCECVCVFVSVCVCVCVLTTGRVGGGTSYIQCQYTHHTHSMATIIMALGIYVKSVLHDINFCYVCSEIELLLKDAPGTPYITVCAGTELVYPSFPICMLLWLPLWLAGL